MREYLDIICFVYLDDICIVSKTDKDHLIHIKKFFAALLEHKLTVLQEKWSFFQIQEIFLGFVISTEGISIDPTELDKIAEWPYPQTLGVLQCGLGFSNFYRWFIPEFSGVEGPLTALTGTTNNSPAELIGEGPKEEFSALRKLFSQAPFLSHFDFNQPGVLQVDASGYALSGILSQKDGGGALGPVAYYSRKLNATK